MLLRSFVIAIDGEAASGKSTVAARLAKQLGYLYFDTGVMYRAVTWAAQKRKINVRDEIAVTVLAETLKIRVTSPTKDDGRKFTVYVGRKDVTWEIREPAVDAEVSVVAAYPGVRRALTEQQRQIAAQGCVVMVGRDIGTVVMPEANLKLYMQASVEERARRRYAELLTRGEKADYQQVLASMIKRDHIDTQRDFAPLRPADDAVLIDTEGVSVDQIVSQVLQLVENRASADRHAEVTSSPE